MREILTGETELHPEVMGRRYRGNPWALLRDLEAGGWLDFWWLSAAEIRQVLQEDDPTMRTNGFCTRLKTGRMVIALDSDQTGTPRQAHTLAHELGHLANRGRRFESEEAADDWAHRFFAAGRATPAVSVAWW